MRLKQDSNAVIITFSPKIEFGIKIYYSNETPKYSVIQDDDSGKYYIRLRESSQWCYPQWQDIQRGFHTVLDAQTWLNKHNWVDATKNHIDTVSASSRLSEFVEAVQLFGFKNVEDDAFRLNFNSDGHNILVEATYTPDKIKVEYWIDSHKLHDLKTPKNTSNVERTIRNIDCTLSKLGHSIFSNCTIADSSNRKSIMAAINTKNLAQDLVRVRSSNIWSFGLNIKHRKDKTGDLLVQFKNDQGGAGDIYIYYDVPVMVYRRWQSAPSKGHYFWLYIRNNYKYSKLTGDKHGKLKNAVN